MKCPQQTKNAGLQETALRFVVETGLLPPETPLKRVLEIIDTTSDPSVSAFHISRNMPPDGYPSPAATAELLAEAQKRQKNVAVEGNTPAIITTTVLGRSDLTLDQLIAVRKFLVEERKRWTDCAKRLIGRKTVDELIRDLADMRTRKEPELTEIIEAQIEKLAENLTAGALAATWPDNDNSSIRNYARIKAIANRWFYKKQLRDCLDVFSGAYPLFMKIAACVRIQSIGTSEGADEFQEACQTIYDRCLKTSFYPARDLMTVWLREETTSDLLSEAKSKARNSEFLAIVAAILKKRDEVALAQFIELETINPRECFSCASTQENLRTAYEKRLRASDTEELLDTARKHPGLDVLRSAIQRLLLDSRHAQKLRELAEI